MSLQTPTDADDDDGHGKGGSEDDCCECFVHVRDHTVRDDQKYEVVLQKYNTNFTLHSNLGSFLKKLGKPERLPLLQQTVRSARRDK